MKNLKIKTMVLALLLTASLAACKKKDGGGGAGLGVPECDDYLARMDACAKKMAGKGGEQLTKMADMMRKAWKDDVKDAEKKKSMPEGCKTAVKDMAKQMPECDWGVAAPAPEGSAAAPAEGSAAAPAEGSAGSGSAAAGSGSAAAGSGSAAP